MRLLVFVSFLLALLWLGLAVAEETSKDNDHKCRTYFAPSTIPGAGFGLFAGRDFKYGEEITPGDLVVPFFDLAYHNGVDSRADLPFLWNNYAWSGKSFAHMSVEAKRTSGASVGMGACPNSFIPLINFGDALEARDGMKVDNADLHRSQDPGVGAFTPYHNRRGLAWTDIPAGMELFLHYGTDYWSGAEYAWMPKEADYAAGDKLLRNFARFRSKVETDRPWLPPAVFSLIKSLRKTWNSPIFNTLPEDLGLVDEIQKIGTKKLYYNRSIASLEFLRENGRCMDLLKPEQSTIKQAGRGAFTTRPIAQGEVVSPAPLIHIPNRSMLDMYLPQPEWKGVQRGEKFHKQLLLNYCWGHKLLDLLLCPYGVMTTFINHSKEKANVKVVWSDRLMAHPEWLEQHPHEWIKSDHAGLAFEYVAIRDLSEGEEVFVNYGDEWDTAWKQHLATWLPAPDSDSYRADYELNDVMHDIVFPVMSKEGLYGTKKCELRCREIFRKWWGRPEFIGGLHWPCRATDRYDVNGTTLYDVEILIYVQNKQGEFCYEVFDEILFGVPSEIFVFEDQLYQRDSTQPWAFRHDMRIPDELVPRAWIAEACTAADISCSVTPGIGSSVGCNKPSSCNSSDSQK